MAAPAYLISIEMRVFEHDCHYRTHHTIFGSPITKTEADYILKRRIQQRSIFGRYSPMAYWRWWVLRHLVKRPWIEGGKVEVVPAQQNPR